MANSARLTRAEISAYIGEDKTNILDNFSKKEWDYFSKLDIDPHKSYFILGSTEKLKKFEAYFLFLCGFFKPLFKKYLLLDYSAILSAPAGSDIDEVGVDRELVILYAHSTGMGYGNTDNWVFKTVLNKIVSRNRQGNPTLVLSERTIEPFQSSDEMKVIDLGGGTLEVSVADAISQVNQESSEASKGVQTSTSSEGVQY